MNKADVGRQLIHTYPNFKLSGLKKGAVRITPLDKNVRATVLDHTEMILRAGFEIKSIITPGELNSKSSKFNTYEIVDNSGHLHQVVFGLGSKGNMGMDFERRIVLELQEFLTNGIEHTMISSFKNTLPDFNVDSVVEGFGRKIKRPLDLVPYDVGSLITDVTFKQKNGDTVYSSLKNIMGITISNNGLRGAFNDQNNLINYSGDPLIDLIFEEVSIDVLKMLQGFNDYKQKQISSFNRKENVVIKHPENLKNLIGSAFGYGYYLVKEVKNKTYNIIDLMTVDKLNAYLGDVKTAELHYPYYKSGERLGKSKSMVINIETDKHKFAFNIRNNTGGIIPNILSLTTI